MLFYMNTIYYIKLQFSLSVCLYPPPFFFDTTVWLQPNLAHIRGRFGTHSQLKKFDPAHPRGTIMSCDVIERRVCEAFKNYRSMFVILRNVGGLIGDFARAPPSIPRSLPSHPSLPPSPPLPTSLPPSPSHPSVPPSPPSLPSHLPSVPLSPPSLPSLSLPPSPPSHPFSRASRVTG